ncbi:DUF4197 domain-containing protein [Alteripontixanthobacter muriae]|uniref:DUF4197 domain-containing protein n=1 Tax=Alteripontixanthobacter muriae TaxID=2705546 RepID=UPI001E49B642|nr:DUF4197 domain-containing protein [Alteripontixanthobacter muriae]
MSGMTKADVVRGFEQHLGRRKFMGGLGSAIGIGGLMMLPGCTSLGNRGFTLTDAIRQMLYLSSERAFTRLTAPGGYWDEQVRTVGLGNILGTRGDVLSNILTSALFRDRLNRAFADIAIEGAERAAPLVADAVRVVGFQNAVDLVRGGPTAATSFLRQQMGGALVEAMVPELARAMRVAEDPLVGQALTALTGVDVGRLATGFSTRVNDAIWQEIGREEAAIRRNPASTRDPLLIGVFGANARLDAAY